MTALTWLAVFQGLYFLLVPTTPALRLVGIALMLLSLLATRMLRQSASIRAAATWAVAVLVVGNFVLNLVLAAPVFPFRTWQLAILLGYSATLLGGLTSLTGAVTFRKALAGWGTVAGVLLLTEGAIGGPEAFSPGKGKVEWVGTTVQDSMLGEHFAPNTVVKTFYPDNPRGYFDEPDALQRRWALDAQEGSKAELQFPPDRRGVIRVRIVEAPGKVGWHIALNQRPIRVVAQERYEVRFRARADSARTIFAAVSQAHPPWNLLGLYREVRVDTTWRDFNLSFRATASDRMSRLYFEFGAERPSVELSNVVMRRIAANQVVQAEARRELSVSYRINSQGCRGIDYGPRSIPGAWRILSLGDGRSFGVGVHEGDTYASRLESLLNESGVNRGPEEHYDVINCGVRGYSTALERRLFNSVGRNYFPNVVLLAVNPDDVRYAAEDDLQPSGATISKFERLFHLWGVVRSLGATPPPPPDYTSLVGEIKQLDDDVRATGARLAVVLFQHREEPEWSTLDSAIVRGLQGTNVPVLNLGPVLLPFGSQKLQVHSVYDQHPNELAHRVTAEALRKFLADQGLLGSARLTAPTPADTPSARR